VQNNFFPVNPPIQPNIFNHNSVTHVVKITPPTQRYQSNEFALVRCKNITTSWIASYGYSYLNEYANDINYCFLTRQDNGFDVNQWSETLTRSKVNKQQMTDFLYQVNTNGELAAKTVRAKQNVSSKRTTCCSLFVLSFLAFVACITMYIMNLSNYRNYSVPLSILLMLGYVFCLVICCTTGFISLFYMSDKAKDYFLDKEIISNISTMENLINDWNNKVFIPNGLYVMAPLNLKYLQFVLDSNVKFVMENHQYPHDLIRRRR